MEAKATPYYPPPESVGGWRFCRDGEIEASAGIDQARLDAAGERQLVLHGDDSWSIAVIRHGYLVRELSSFNVLVPSRFDIWSCTKSFTGTAFGLLFDDARDGQISHSLDLGTRAYELIPQGQPLTDPRKTDITLTHLLSMTSGLPGESAGVIGMPTATGVGPFEHALGHSPNRYGRSVAELQAVPGAAWDYSDAGMAHLALAFHHITGREIAAYMDERVLRPIGIEGLSWDVQGGSGAIGPHTNGHTGIHVSARDLARFGYLFLRGGSWAGRQLVPRWWIDLATRSSQDINPDFGYLWWVNDAGTKWPALPRDAFAAAGYRSNRCYVIPSLDLVVARVGTGPVEWNEQELISSIVASVIDE